MRFIKENEKLRDFIQMFEQVIKLPNLEYEHLEAIASYAKEQSIEEDDALDQ